MTDLQQRRSRKMRRLTEIKQEVSNSEENEGDFVNSMTSPNHFSSQIVIKHEESSSSEDSVQLNKITSVICQAKTEPESDEKGDGCELGSAAGNPLLDGFVIKREIIEEHAEEHHMMDDEGNHKKTTRYEDSGGTEAARNIKSENDNFSPNFSDNNIDEHNNKFDQTKKMKKQRLSGRINVDRRIFYTQANTLCKTRKSHECSVCSKAFHSSQACLLHIWNTHTGENPYTCEVCGKRFKYLKNLQMHKAVHSDERPYSCDLCDKTFKYLKNLQMHKAIHSDERPYSCDLCDKTFKQNGHLRRHKVLCHSDERPYSCDLCDKAFKQEGVLQRHKVSCHSHERSYTCELCDKAFKLKKHVQDHVVTCHSDERPYSCELCDKAFKRKRELRRHNMSSHSDARPYSCDVCKKTFKQKGDLNKHKRTVHSDEKP